MEAPGAYLAGVAIGGSVVCVLAVLLVLNFLFRSATALRRQQRKK